MGIQPSYPKPNTSRAAKYHPEFPYLLGTMRIWLPNQVWATDITYIRFSHTNIYLSAIIDWATRIIVGWELSDTLEAAPVVKCFERTIEEHGVPAVTSSDQGSTYTADIYVNCLAEHGIRQSVDGKARWVDNAENGVAAAPRIRNAASAQGLHRAVR